MHKARAILHNGASWRTTAVARDIFHRIASTKSEAVLRRSAGLARDVLHRVAPPRSEAVLLRVDLRDPQNRVGPADASGALRLARFDDRTLEDLTVRARRTDPAVPGRLRIRLHQKAEGYVAYDGTQAIGCAFHIRGTHDPAHVVHPDLRWLGLRPTSNERYVFDLYVHPDHMEVGTALLRTAQEAYHRAGIERAYGYVYAHDETVHRWFQAAGWTELGRVRERRFTDRLALIDGTLYWRSGTARRPIWSR